MTQSATVSAEDQSLTDNEEQNRPIYKPEGWQWKTIAAVAFGQAIPGFYIGPAYGTGVFTGSVLILYLLVVIGRIVAGRIGWDDTAGVFAQVSILAAVASVPVGVLSIPAVPVYILLLLVIYVPLQLLISGGSALFAYGSRSDS